MINKLPIHYYHFIPYHPLSFILTEISFSSIYLSLYNSITMSLSLLFSSSHSLYFFDS